MAVEWTKYCAAADLSVIDGSHIDVAFHDNRRHRLTVIEDEKGYTLRAIVVRQRIVTAMVDLPIHIWLRNRSTDLVGFHIDNRGRLVGESWIPKIGVTREEFQLYVRKVAIECDRLEFLLTGQDAE